MALGSSVLQIFKLIKLVTNNLDTLHSNQHSFGEQNTRLRWLQEESVEPKNWNRYNTHIAYNELWAGATNLLWRSNWRSVTKATVKPARHRDTLQSNAIKKQHGTRLTWITTAFMMQSIWNLINTLEQYASMCIPKLQLIAPILFMGYVSVTQYFE